MKYKNYKSAIHNFAHSFQSIDYSKSGKLAFNVLVNLHKQGIPPIAIFDFKNRTIEPVEAISNSSRQLLNDYLDWLPEHFQKHNCDIFKLEVFKVVISVDFDRAFTPSGMNYCKQINIKTKTFWKTNNNEEQKIEIAQDELIENNYFENGIPEI